MTELFARCCCTTVCVVRNLVFAWHFDAVSEIAYVSELTHVSSFDIIITNN